MCRPGAAWPWSIPTATRSARSRTSSSTVRRASPSGPRSRPGSLASSAAWSRSPTRRRPTTTRSACRTRRSRSRTRPRSTLTASSPRTRSASSGSTTAARTTAIGRATTGRPRWTCRPSPGRASSPRARTARTSCPSSWASGCAASSSSPRCLTTPSRTPPRRADGVLAAHEGLCAARRSGLGGQGLADRLGEHEAHVLLDDLELLDLLGAARAEEGDEALDELLRRAGAGGDADGAGPLQPLLSHLLLGVDEVRVGAVLARDLHEAVGVRRIARADDEHEVAVRRHLLDGRLAVRGGVADVIGAGTDDAREALAQAVDDRARLVDRQRGLRDVGQLLGIGDLEGVDVGLGLHEDDVLGCLPHRPLDLLVAVVADEDDGVALGRELERLAMDLGHQRAGGVDRAQPAPVGLGVHRRRHAMGAEDGHRALRDRVVELLDEDRPALAQLLDDVLVVHDLLAHVHGSAVELEGMLDRLHRPADARAIAARGGEEQLLGGGGHAPMVGAETLKRPERWPIAVKRCDRYPSQPWSCPSPCCS